jgi:hypothetical protein|tara:strand:- start:1706 stop:2041 length:336 start_codon:yes stop_codon:yes gene_type:complete
MVWVSKREYKNLLEEVIDLRERVAQYKDDTGEALIERLTRLAKKAGLDVHSKEYQDIMNRVFLDVGGRQSNVLKGYSATSFMKDNSEEVLSRVKKFQKEASLITKSLEDKS